MSAVVIFVILLQLWCVSLFGQQSPTAPYSRSCVTEEMKSAITDVSYAASRTPILKLINSMAIILMFNLTGIAHNGLSWLSLPEGGPLSNGICNCAHSARRRAQAPERAQDSEYVHGEKLFSSSSSADCTEVEYATKLYSKSSPPVGTKTDNAEIYLSLGNSSPDWHCFLEHGRWCAVRNIHSWAGSTVMPFTDVYV